MKKVLSIILSIAVAVTAMAGFATVTYAATRSYTSGNLSCTLDTDTGLFTVKGNGSGANYTSSNGAPWASVKSSIKDIVIESGVKNIGAYWFYGCTSLNTIIFNENSTVEEIGQYAFYDCTNTTFWLNLPESLKTIGANAFNNTGFNWVTFDSPKVSVQTNSFGQTGWAQFSGITGSGVSDFVKAGKNLGYNWRYLCLRDHVYAISEHVDATCANGGYNIFKCTVCDADTVTENIDALGHNFTKSTATGNGTFAYVCSRCNARNLEVSALSLLSNFYKAISHDNDNTAYNQSNYDSSFDVLLDGYINAKDFILIQNEANKINVTNKQTTIDTNTTYQTIEGFGASGCWWAQDIGRWNDEQIDRVTELLYGEEGAGLDIYRYNLGGGSENDTAISDWRRRAEDFLSSSSNINDASTYDWNADAAAQRVLASAQRANNDLKLTLFSNTPPISITKNGKGYCDPQTSKTNILGKKTVTFNENLDSSNYQSFANYVANCAEHFIDMGYNVTNVSPINEPGWAWDGPSQEGCHYSATSARDFYNKYMIPTIQSRAKLNNKVDVSVWECEQLQIDSRDNNDNYYKKFLPNMFSSYNGYTNSTKYGNNNANIRSYVDSFDTHSYWASTDERKTTASDISGSNYSAIKKVRCTEYCQMTNDGSSGCYNYHTQVGQYTDGNGMSMYYGLALADIMYQDLTILNAVEWDWWTACSGGIYPDGLVYVDYNDPNNIQTAKRLWVMGNYARFIEEGAKRVAVTTGSNFGKNLQTATTYGDDKSNYIEQTAYVNPDGSVVVVYINNSDTDEYTSFNGYSTLETYVTDENHDLELYQSGTAENRAVYIPAMSVTTVVLNK
ncbi:MAG: leucine-rich repeat protein [Clostridium sp.]|nr:leucine-rich repeat protein [Clostridium sp.]